MGLISSEQLTNELEQNIPGSTSLNVISAFVSMPAVKWLGNIVNCNKTEVCIVGRFTPIDFVQGASELEALRKCIEQGYSVKALSNLHAKIYQIDKDKIFTGSANLTGKGLALVGSSNLESCARVDSTEDSILFISKIISASSYVTLEILERMEEYLSDLDLSSAPEVLVAWPEEIVSKANSIFVSDFPLSSPGQPTAAYLVNPSLEFAAIEANRADLSLAKRLFKASKAYCWLLSHLKGAEKNRGLRFGEVSSLLHDDLSDDPAPYRQEIKALVSHLYEYIELYAIDEMKIDVPGKRSQVVTLL